MASLGTVKARSANFSKEEEIHLVSLYTEQKQILEGKHGSRFWDEEGGKEVYITKSTKTMAWVELTNKFNRYI